MYIVTFTCELELAPPSEIPPIEIPPPPPLVLLCTCVMAPLTRIWAGVMLPTPGVMAPCAVRPEAAKSCSPMASLRISVSPSTMNLPVWLRISVMMMPQPSPMSHWPRQPARFSNLATETV